MTKEEKLKELAREYNERIAAEKDFDKREELLVEHQKKHDTLANKEQRV